MDQSVGHVGLHHELCALQLRGAAGRRRRPGAEVRALRLLCSRVGLQGLPSGRDARRGAGAARRDRRAPGEQSAAALRRRGCRGGGRSQRLLQRAGSRRHRRRRSRAAQHRPRHVLHRPGYDSHRRRLRKAEHDVRSARAAAASRAGVCVPAGRRRGGDALPGGPRHRAVRPGRSGAPAAGGQVPGRSRFHRTQAPARSGRAESDHAHRRQPIRCRVRTWICCAA